MFNKITNNPSATLDCITAPVDTAGNPAVATMLSVLKYVATYVKDEDGTGFAANTIEKLTLVLPQVEVLIESVKEEIKDITISPPVCYNTEDYIKTLINASEFNSDLSITLYSSQSLPQYTEDGVLTTGTGVYYSDAKKDVLPNTELAAYFAKVNHDEIDVENVNQIIGDFNKAMNALAVAAMCKKAGSLISKYIHTQIQNVGGDGPSDDLCMLGHLINTFARVLKCAVTNRQHNSCPESGVQTCPESAGGATGDMSVHNDGCNVVSCDPYRNNDIKTLTSYFQSSLSAYVVQIAENIILKAGGCKIDDFILTVLVMFVMDNMDSEILDTLTFIRTNPNPTDPECVVSTTTHPPVNDVYFYDAQISQLDCISHQPDSSPNLYHAVAINKNGGSMTGRLCVWPDTRREPIYDPNSCRALHRYIVSGYDSVIGPDACGDITWNNNNILMLVMDSPIELENFVHYARSFAINNRAPRCPRDPSSLADCSISYPPVTYPVDFADGGDMDYPICPTDVAALSDDADGSEQEKRRKLYALTHLLHIRKQLGGAGSRVAVNNGEMSCSPIDDTFDICDRAMGPMYCPLPSSAPTPTAGQFAEQQRPESGLHCFVVDKQYIKDDDGNYYKLNDHLYREFSCCQQTIWHHKYLNTNVREGFTKIVGGGGNRIRRDWSAVTKGTISDADTTHSFDFANSFEAEHSFCLLGHEPLLTRRQFMVEKTPTEVAFAKCSVMPDVVGDDEVALAGQLANDGSTAAVLNSDKTKVYLPIPDGEITLEDIRDKLHDSLDISRDIFYFRDEYHQEIEVKSKWTIYATMKDGTENEPIVTDLGTSTVTLTSSGVVDDPTVSSPTWDLPNLSGNVLTLLSDVYSIRDVNLEAYLTQKVRHVYNNDIEEKESPTGFGIQSRMVDANSLGGKIKEWLRVNPDGSGRNALAIDVECDIITEPMIIQVHFVGKVETPSAITVLLNEGVRFVTDPEGAKERVNIVEDLVNDISLSFNATPDENGYSVLNANSDEYKFALDGFTTPVRVSALLGNGYHLNRKHSIYQWALASLPNATPVESSVYAVSPTLIALPSLGEGDIFPDGYNAVILEGTYAAVGFVVARDHSVSSGCGLCDSESYTISDGAPITLATFTDTQLSAGDPIDWASHGPGYNYYYPAYVARDGSDTSSGPEQSASSAAAAEFNSQSDVPNWSSSQLSKRSDQISFSSPALKHPGVGAYSTASIVQNIRRAEVAVVPTSTDGVTTDSYGEEVDTDNINEWDAAIRHLVCLTQDSMPGNADKIPDLDDLCPKLGDKTVRGGIRTTTLTLDEMSSAPPSPSALTLVYGNGTNKNIHYKTTGCDWVFVVKSVTDWTARDLVESLDLPTGFESVDIVVDGASYRINTTSFEVLARSSPFQLSPLKHDERKIIVSAKWIVSTSGKTSNNEDRNPPKVDPAHLISRDDLVRERYIGTSFNQFGTVTEIKDAFTFSNTGHQYNNGKWTVQGVGSANDMGVTGVVWVKRRGGGTMQTLDAACNKLEVSNGVNMRQFWQEIGCDHQQGIFEIAAAGETLSALVRGTGDAPINVQSGDLRAAFVTSEGGGLDPLPPAWTPLFTPEATIKYQESVAETITVPEFQMTLAGSSEATQQLNPNTDVYTWIEVDAFKAYLATFSAPFFSAVGQIWVKNDGNVRGPFNIKEINPNDNKRGKAYVFINTDGTNGRFTTAATGSSTPSILYFSDPDPGANWSGDRPYETFGRKSQSGITQVIATVAGEGGDPGFDAPITFRQGRLPDDRNDARIVVWSGSALRADAFLTDGHVEKAWELFAGIHTLSLSVLSPDSVVPKIIDDTGMSGARFPPSTADLTSDFTLCRDDFVNAEIVEVEPVQGEGIKGQETNSAQIQYDYVGNIKVKSDRLTGGEAFITNLDYVEIGAMGNSNASGLTAFPIKLGLLAQYKPRYATSTSVILDASDEESRKNPFGTVAYFEPIVSNPGQSMTVNIIEHNLYKLSEWLENNAGELDLNVPYHEQDGSYGFDSTDDHKSIARLVGSRLAEWAVGLGNAPDPELDHRRLFVEKESTTTGPYTSPSGTSAFFLNSLKLCTARYFMLPTVTGSLESKDIAMYPYSQFAQTFVDNGVNMGIVGVLRERVLSGGCTGGEFIGGNQPGAGFASSQACDTRPFFTVNTTFPPSLLTTWKQYRILGPETRSDIALGLTETAGQSPGAQHVGTTTKANTPNLFFSQFSQGSNQGPGVQPFRYHIRPVQAALVAHPALGTTLSSPLVGEGVGPPIAVYGVAGGATPTADAVWDKVCGSQSYDASLVYWKDDIEGVAAFRPIQPDPFTQAVPIEPTLDKSELILGAYVGAAANLAITSRRTAWSESLADGSTVAGALDSEAIAQEAATAVGGIGDIYSDLGPIAVVYTTPPDGFLGEASTTLLTGPAHCVELPGTEAEDNAWTDVLTWNNIFGGNNDAYAFAVTKPTDLDDIQEGQWSAYVTATLKIELWSSALVVIIMTQTVEGVLSTPVGPGNGQPIDEDKFREAWDSLVERLSLENEKEVYKMRSTVTLTDSRSGTIGGGVPQQVAERVLVTHFNRTHDMSAYIDAIEELLPLCTFRDCESVLVDDDADTVLGKLKVERFLGFIKSGGVYQTVQQDMTEWQTRTDELYVALRGAAPTSTLADRIKTAIKIETDEKLPDTYFLLVRVGETRQSVMSKSALGLTPGSSLQDRKVIGVIAPATFEFPQFPSAVGNADLGTHDITNIFLNAWANHLSSTPGDTLDIGEEFRKLVDSTTYPEHQWMSITVVNAHDCIPDGNDNIVFLTDHQIIFNAKKRAYFKSASAPNVNCDITHTNLMNAYAIISDVDKAKFKSTRSADAHYYSDDGTNSLEGDDFISVPITGKQGARLRPRDRLQLSSTIAMSGDYEEDETHLKCIVDGLNTYYENNSDTVPTRLGDIIEKFKSTYRVFWKSAEKIIPMSCDRDGNAVGVSPTLPGPSPTPVIQGGTLDVNGITLTIAARYGASGKFFKITGGLAVNAIGFNKYPEQDLEIGSDAPAAYNSLPVLYDSSQTPSNKILKSDMFEPAIVSDDILGVYVAGPVQRRSVRIDADSEESYFSELAKDPFNELVKLKIEVRKTLDGIEVLNHELGVSAALDAATKLELDDLWDYHLKKSVFVYGLRGTSDNAAEIEKLKTFISQYKLYATTLGAGAVKAFSKFDYVAGLFSLDFGIAAEAMHIASVARENSAISSQLDTSGGAEVKYGEVQTASIVFKSKDVDDMMYNIAVITSKTTWNVLLEVRGTVEMKEKDGTDLLATSVVTKHSQRAPHVFRIAYAIDDRSNQLGGRDQDIPFSFGSHVGDSDIEFLLDNITAAATAAKGTTWSSYWGGLLFLLFNVGLNEPVWVDTQKDGSINSFESDKLYIAIQGRNPPIAVHVVDNGGSVSSTSWPSGNVRFDKYVAVVKISKNTGSANAGLANAVFDHIKDGVPVDQLIDANGANISDDARTDIVNFLDKFVVFLGGIDVGIKRLRASEYFPILARESSDSELTTITLAESVRRSRVLAREAIQARDNGLNDLTNLARVIYQKDQVSQSGDTRYSIFERQLALNIVGVHTTKIELQKRFLAAAERLDDRIFVIQPPLSAAVVWDPKDWANIFGGGSSEVKAAGVAAFIALGRYNTVSELKAGMKELRTTYAYNPTASQEDRYISILILAMLTKEPTQSSGEGDLSGLNDINQKIDQLTIDIGLLAKETTLETFITNYNSKIEKIALSTLGGLLGTKDDKSLLGYDIESVQKYMKIFGEVITAKLGDLEPLVITRVITKIIEEIIGLSETIAGIEKSLGITDTVVAEPYQNSDIIQAINLIKKQITTGDTKITEIKTKLDEVSTNLNLAIGDAPDMTLYDAISAINTAPLGPDAFANLVTPLTNTYVPFLNYDASAPSPAARWSIRTPSQLKTSLGVTHTYTETRTTDSYDLVEKKGKVEQKKIFGIYLYSWVKVASKSGPVVDPTQFVDVSVTGLVTLKSDLSTALVEFVSVLNSIEAGTFPLPQIVVTEAESLLLIEMHRVLRARSPSGWG